MAGPKTVSTELFQSRPRRRAAMSTRIPEKRLRISLGLYSNATEHLFCRDWWSWIPALRRNDGEEGMLFGTDALVCASDDDSPWVETSPP